MAELEVWTLPEDLVLPLIAAWRVMEKSLNPAFSFPMKCSKCGKLSDANKNQGPQFTRSKKERNGFPIIIGIKCQTENCTMVIKFERPISPGDPDFPQRLKRYPASALTDPEGAEGSVKEGYIKTVAKYLELQ